MAKSSKSKAVQETLSIAPDKIYTREEYDAIIQEILKQQEEAKKLQEELASQLEDLKNANVMDSADDIISGGQIDPETQYAQFLRDIAKKREQANINNAPINAERPNFAEDFEPSVHSWLYERYAEKEAQLLKVERQLAELELTYERFITTSKGFWTDNDKLLVYKNIGTKRMRAKEYIGYARALLVEMENTANYAQNVLVSNSAANMLLVQELYNFYDFEQITKLDPTAAAPYNTNKYWLDIYNGAYALRTEVKVTDIPIGYNNETEGGNYQPEGWDNIQNGTWTATEYWRLNKLRYAQEFLMPFFKASPNLKKLLLWKGFNLEHESLKVPNDNRNYLKEINPTYDLVHGKMFDPDKSREDYLLASDEDITASKTDTEINKRLPRNAKSTFHMVARAIMNDANSRAVTNSLQKVDTIAFASTIFNEKGYYLGEEFELWVAYLKKIIATEHLEGEELTEALEELGLECEYYYEPDFETTKEALAWIRNNNFGPCANITLRLLDGLQEDDPIEVFDYNNLNITFTGGGFNTRIYDGFYVKNSSVVLKDLTFAANMKGNVDANGQPINHRCIWADGPGSTIVAKGVCVIGDFKNTEKGVKTFINGNQYRVFESLAYSRHNENIHQYVPCPYVYSNNQASIVLDKCVFLGNFSGSYGFFAGGAASMYIQQVAVNGNISGSYGFFAGGAASMYIQQVAVNGNISGSHGFFAWGAASMCIRQNYCKSFTANPSYAFSEAGAMLAYHNRWSCGDVTPRSQVAGLWHNNRNSPTGFAICYSPHNFSWSELFKNIVNTTTNTNILDSSDNKTKIGTTRVESKYVEYLSGLKLGYIKTQTLNLQNEVQDTKWEYFLPISDIWAIGEYQAKSHWKKDYEAQQAKLLGNS